MASRRPCLKQGRKLGQHPRLSLAKHADTHTHTQICTNISIQPITCTSKTRSRQRDRLLQNHGAWTNGRGCRGQFKGALEYKAEGGGATHHGGKRNFTNCVCGTCYTELRKNSGPSLTIKHTAAEVPAHYCYFFLPNLWSRAA